MDKNSFPQIQINRTPGPGEYRISDIFPLLDEHPVVLEIFKDRRVVEDVFQTSAVRIIKRKTYMFVDNEDGAINIGIGHLKTSEPEILHLDIIHELVHVRQHREGRDLYDRSKSYVDRETEIEAYEYTIREARRIGLSDPEIMDYLSVEWISPEEHLRLATCLGVMTN